MVEAPLGGGEHRMRFAGDPAKDIGGLPTRTMRMYETTQPRCEPAVERNRPALCAGKRMNARHAFGIEADADDGARHVDGMFVVGGDYDRLSVRVARG